MKTIAPQTDEKEARIRRTYIASIASHAAWEIAKNGQARPKRLYLALHILLIFPLLFDVFIRDQVLLIHGGYGEYQSLLRWISAVVTIGALWLASAIWRIGEKYFSTTLLIAPYLFAVNFLVLHVAFSSVPKIMTRFQAAPIVVKAELIVVTERRHTKYSWLKAVFGRKGKYEFEILGQPEIVSYLSNSNYGYSVYPRGGSRRAQSQPIYFSGDANWFGISVNKIFTEVPASGL